MDEMQNGIPDFLVESREGLDQFDRDLEILEQGAAESEPLDRMVHTIHLITVSSGSFGFLNLESVAHAGESLLVQLRDGERHLHAEMISGLCDLVNAARQMLITIEDSGDDGDADYMALIATLTRLQEESVSLAPEVFEPLAEAEAPGVNANENLDPETLAPEREDANLEVDPMQGAIQDFLTESYEGLDQFDLDLETLERDVTEPEALGRIFRVIHTVTGSSGCFGFLNLESVAHAGESLLAQLRDGELHLHAEMISNLRALVDAVRQMLAIVEESGDDGDGDYTALIETLTRLQEEPVPSEVSELLAEAPDANANGNSDPESLTSSRGDVDLDPMQGAIQEFLAESDEGLDQFDLDLETLDHDTPDPETLSRMFRIIHTITGGSGCFGFLNLESVAQAGESLLGQLREGLLHLHAEMVSGLRALVGAARQMLVAIEDSRGDSDVDYTALIETLTRLQEESASPEASELLAESSETHSTGDPDPESSVSDRVDADLQLDPMQNAIQEFLIESYEGLDRLDRDWAALEQDSTNLEPLGSMFGIIHAVTDGSGCFGFLNLESVAYAGESLLGQLRKGELHLHAEMISGLRALIDAIHQMLATIQDSGDDGDADYTVLTETLSRLQEAAMPPEGSAPRVEVPEAHATGAANPESSASDRGEAVQDAMQNAIQDFLIESSEGLDQLDRDLLALEQDATDPELLSNVFRIIHTIKGSGGCFGFLHLESVAHVGENLLSRLREGELHLHSEMISGLLALADALRQMLGTIQESGDDGDADYTALTETLARLQEGPTPSVLELSETLIVPYEPLGDTLDPSTHTAVDRQARDIQREARSMTVADNTIRIDVTLLDRLMNQVGELVLTRNQILQFSSLQEDATFAAVCHRLNLITAELQEGIMKTRMQPIGAVWSRLPRIVRDLAIACGKQVRLKMEGQDTELDKSIIEAIRDPLTHAVRNVVDHGIETPESRLARGKSAEGQLLLRAFHEHGQVNIDISDDGAGIDLERVKQKALQRDLIAPEQAANLSERELLNLLFLPGFSTAEQITNISGRGVGLDVMKSNVEKLGGTVDIQSTRDEGTTLKIKLPLTLAIIPALVVTSAGDRYAIPQENLQELVRLEVAQARSRIEMIHGTPVYRLRGQLLPLVYLTEALQVANPTTGTDEEQSINIVVLQVESRKFGLVVDAINDVEEIVVKPLAKQLKGISVFAGAAIMGDGRASLILDLLGLAQHTHVLAEEEGSVHMEQPETSYEDAEDLQTLLLFRTTDNGRMAVPLSMVARLEELPRAEVEIAGNEEVIQYREQILPLIDLAKLLPERRQAPRYENEDEAENIHVIVFSDQRRSVGLVVEHILDIVEESLDVQGRTSREGVLGTVVIQGRVTELLDVDWAIRKGAPTFFELTSASAVEV